MTSIIGAEMFVRSKQTGKFLMILRDDLPQISNPGCWIPPSGHMDEGETPQQAAVRETYEEVGLVCEHVEHIGNAEIDLAYIDGRQTLTITDPIFLTVVDETTQHPELHEGQRMEWFTFDECVQLRMPNGLAEFMQSNREVLCGKK